MQRAEDIKKDLNYNLDLVKRNENTIRILSDEISIYKS